MCGRLEHQRLGEELSTLQKSLELKELQIMKVTASSTQVEALRLQFEKHVRALESKRTKLERERQELSMVACLIAFCGKTAILEIGRAHV